MGLNKPLIVRHGAPIDTPAFRILPATMIRRQGHHVPFISTITFNAPLVAA